MGRFNILLFELIFFPIFVQLDFLLHLWLGNVPPNVLLLTQINLILAGISLTCGGLGPLIRAYGKIKWFQIELSFYFVICLPLSYLLLYLGYEPYWILIIYIIADICNRITQMFLLKFLIKFDSAKYIREAYLRPSIIAFIMIFVVCFISDIQVNTAFESILIITITFILSTGLVWFIGLKKTEQMSLLEGLKKRKQG